MKNLAYRTKQHKRILAYGLVGVLAFTLEYTSFIFLISVLAGGSSLMLSQSISFFVGLITSFTGNRQFTFNSKNETYTHSAKKQALAYLTLATLNLVLSNIVIHALVNYLNVEIFIAKVVVMVMVVLWNFLIFNKFIFKSE